MEKEKNKPTEKEAWRRAAGYWLLQIVCVLGGILDILLLCTSFLYLEQAEHVYPMPLELHIGGRVFFFVGFFGILLILLILTGENDMKTVRLLEEKCDPFLYEAVWDKTYRFIPGRDKSLCNLAVAEYCQGDADKARSTLERIRSRKLKGTCKLNYYLIKSSIYFEHGKGEQVKELEEEFKKRISRRGDGKNMRRLCANNNLQRAYDNKDYAAAYTFLGEWRYLNDKRFTTKIKVSLSCWEAKIALACGNLPEAEVRAREAVQYGNRTIMAEEAKKILQLLEKKENIMVDEEVRNESR